MAACLPPPLVLLGLGEVAGPPLSLPPRGILFQLGLGGGGILLPEGVGLSWRALPWPASLPPSSPLYTEARHPKEHTS